MTEERIPSPVIGEVARALEAEHSHAEIDNLFMRAGANVGAADGVSKLRKIDRWLRKIDADPDVDALGVLGRLLEDFMERQPPPFLQYYENRSLEKAWHERRKRVRDAMAARGLSYQTGGRVRGGALHAPSKSLAALIRGLISRHCTPSLSGPWRASNGTLQRPSPRPARFWRRCAGRTSRTKDFPSLPISRCIRCGR